MKVLAIGAHFDDIELGCAGSLMRHIDKGDEVTMLVVAHSGYSTYDGKLLRTKTQSLKEGKAAAKIIGARLICGKRKTKTLAYSYELIEFLNKWIDKLGVDLIYGHWDHDVHQDHSAIGKAILNAGRRVPRILMYRSNWYQTTKEFRGTFYVDISRYIDRKIEAVRAHKTECRMRGNRWVDFFKKVNANHGQEMDTEYAECFETVRYLMQ
ncbi:MAG: PIG-L family deacetylase [Candidatus Omnitrophica bacterium]|nr:PIG-L family deacetylase [Candidatus Omnitrophota bacterium]